MAAFAVAMVLGLLSDGVHHDDDLAHFLMARWAGWFPEYLLHFWARPGFTLLHAAAAWVGSGATAWHVCRLLSAAVTLTATLLAVRVAEQWRVRPLWAVAAACAAQPVAFVLSYTTLTENVAALWVMGAVALLLSGRRGLASAVFSLALVTRYDTAVMLPAWWWGLGRGAPRGAARGPAWPAVLLSLWAPAAQAVLLRGILGIDVWQLWSRPRGSSEYHPAGPLAYVPQLLLAVPPVIAALALVGGARLAGQRRGWLPMMAASFAAAHVGVKALGLYASGGFARFMVAVFPLVAICAAAGLAAPESAGFGVRRRRSAWRAAALVFAVGGAALAWEHQAGRLRLPSARAATWRVCAAGGVAVLCGLCGAGRATGGRRAAARGVAGVLALSVLAQWVALARPLRPNPAARRIDEAVGWVRSAGLADRPIFACSPWVAHRLGLVESPRIRKSVRLLASMPVGTVVVWDAVYCANDYHRVPLAVVRDDGAYVRRRAWPDDASALPEVAVFEKVSATAVPRDDPPSYPPDIMGTQTPNGSYYVRDQE
ncbi:MAG: hypothetical protein U1A27_08345 [Phycisphaerae bacterium]